MDRHEVTQLQYNYPLSKTFDGKEKVYEEVYIEAGGQASEAVAKRQLEKIREGHPAKSGWHTEIGHEGVFEEKGLYYAFRHHAKYA